MGMKIYERSEMFDPAEHGLNIGDEINIICVGGGEGGAGGVNVTNGASMLASVAGAGGAGGASSFGNVVTARGGFKEIGQFITNTTNSGGAGGFILGVIDWGSICQSSADEASKGSAGFQHIQHKRNRWDDFRIGGGNISNQRSGGSGYGAGGAGGLGGNNTIGGGRGGNSGEVKYATHRLSSLLPIPVSVGGGGGGGGGISVDGAGSEAVGGAGGAGGNNKSGSGGGAVIVTVGNKITGNNGSTGGAGGVGKSNSINHTPYSGSSAINSFSEGAGKGPTVEYNKQNQSLNTCGAPGGSTTNSSTGPGGGAGGAGGVVIIFW